MNLQRFIKNGDLETIAKIAHRLKPSIDNLLITSITATIRDIEKNAVQYGIGKQLETRLQKVEQALLNIITQLENK